MLQGRAHTNGSSRRAFALQVAATIFKSDLSNFRWQRGTEIIDSVDVKSCGTLMINIVPFAMATACVAASTHCWRQRQGVRDSPPRRSALLAADTMHSSVVEHPVSTLYITHKLETETETLRPG